MFTGIIEATGLIESVDAAGTNSRFWISSSISAQLKADQSVSHNGVCLTVEEVSGNRHRVTAVAETLNKTTLKQWKEGHLINLERCMIMNGRLDGHLVQGHVDATATCLSVQEMGGSHVYRFQYPEQFAPLVVEKGSVCLDGISLTAFGVGKNEFSVAIIPYTFEHTNLRLIKAGHFVNIEFDLLGKYIQRHLQLRG